MKHINHIVIIAGILLTCTHAYGMKALQRLSKNTHRKQIQKSPKKVHYTSNTPKKKKTESCDELRRLNDQHEVIFRHYQASAGLFERDPE
jgi:hypothetical protein